MSARMMACTLLGLALVAPAASGAEGAAPGAGEPSASMLEQQATPETSPTGWRPIERLRTDPWRFHAAIYGWLPEAPARISVGPITADLPEDLGTILDSLRFTTQLHAEAHKGPFGVFVSPSYYKGRRGHRLRRARHGPLAGPRNGPLQHTDRRPAEPLGLRQALDPGGWNVDDVHNTYQAWGTLGYHFTMGGVRSKVFAGYRYLVIDYRPRPVKLKLRVRGPLLGIGFDF